MSVDPIDRLEAGAQAAEDAWRRGDFAGALEHYARAIGERLANSKYGVDASVRLEAADFVVFERLSDLARLFGRTKEADELLAISINQINAAGNRYWADLLRVKRIDLALGRGRLRTAQSLLDEMQPSIGDVTRISFTSAGLKDWERRCQWPNTDEGDRATIFALLYFVMGRLLAALGQYGQAEESFRRGLAHATQKQTDGYAYAGPQELAKQAVASLELALVAVLVERGELERAATQLKRLDAAAQEKLRPALFVQTLELQGKRALLAGEFGAALESFRQVLDLCVRRGFVRAAVAATLNLAHALIFLNQTLDARRHLQLAREHAQRSGDRAAVARAEWLLQLAAARAQSLADGVPVAQTVTEQWGFNEKGQQRPDGAAQAATDDAPPESQATRAFAGGVNPLELPQADNYLAFFEERVLGFHWLLARRDFDACAAYLTQLQKIFAPTDSPLIKLRLRILSGLLAYYREEFAQAEALLTAAQPELQRLRLLPELWQAQRVLVWCRRKLGRDVAAQEELVTENARVLGAMTGTLAQADRAFFLLNKWTAEEEELAVRIDQLSRMKTELPRLSWYQRLRHRRRLRAQLEELLSIVDRYRDITAERMTRAPARAQAVATGARHKDLQNVPPPTARWRRLWRHKRRHATLSFLVLPDRTFIARRTRFTLDFGVSPVTRIEVRELVRQWHEIVVRVIKILNPRGLGEFPEPSAPELTEQETAALLVKLEAEAREIADRLSELLQLPSMLDSLPRSTRTLTLVPDDSLHGFPFAAITHRGRYLIEQFALAFAYHSDEAEPEVQHQAGKRNALLVGASRAGGQWRELACVPDELNSLAGWAAQRKLSVERLDDATTDYAAPDKSAVLTALPQATLAHVACHGLFTPDQPAHSGIILRPAQQPDVLSVQELAALDLKQVRHVTLSACWSADHFILPGRWVISLPETLARAGAASVLGCLWVVDDRIGAAFMTQFYHHLNAHPRAEALRRTQLDCLRGQLTDAATPQTAQPIFWAGYQLYGRSYTLKL